MKRRNSVRLRSRCGKGATLVLVFLTAGCSGESAMSRADWTWWRGGGSRDVPALSMTTAPPGGLVAPDGRCPEDANQPVRGIGLGMTECDLVRQVGPTGGIEIGTNERGERTAVITYQQGERAGVYRFTSGLLVSIERAPDAPAATKPQRRTRGGQAS